MGCIVADLPKSGFHVTKLVWFQKLNGGTTVSGTMVAAHIAGIQVFVTGGIGGVHRGAENCKYNIRKL